MRPLTEKNPASTNRRLHGREAEGSEEHSQDEPEGVFQASASSHSMNPLNPWTWDGVGNCSTEWMNSLANVGWKGEKPTKKGFTGDRTLV